MRTGQGFPGGFPGIAGPYGPKSARVHSNAATPAVATGAGTAVVGAAHAGVIQSGRPENPHELQTTTVPQRIPFPIIL